MSRKNKNLLIVRSVTERGLTHAQAATRFGVSRQWVHTHVTTSNADTGEVIAQRTVDPNSDYQPPRR